jgi:catechol 2,3-dioxygenase-like lactoylglutathione lyase family enzyme
MSTDQAGRQPPYGLKRQRRRRDPIAWKGAARCTTFRCARSAADSSQSGPALEPTFNRARDEPYELGDGYNHMAVAVEALDATLAALAREGIEQEKPPYSPGGRDEVGRICFVRDPDGYRIELIDGGDFATPQDPDS